MNNKIFILFLLGTLFSCSKSDSDTEETENLSPSVPNLIFPTNNLFCIDNNLSLEWTVSNDPERDTITYRLEVSENEDFTTFSHIQSTTSTSFNIAFEKGQRYFWRVQAVDNFSNQSAYSNIFEFYTEGESISNYLPYAPDLVSPSPNSTISQIGVLLEWDCNDPDADQLSYDIFLSTTNPPEELIAEARISNNFSIDLDGGSTYYWRVIAKDSPSSSTAGQVWSFNTN
ncbi:hypothetical protein Q2T40_16665 [Winogradskyella maritima]|uniref:Fibronectin type-III domain-containing protein n=1 Tax=Winogradskyella maritima TaxID=1517766 RepID=A0ABV8AF94_9FLAO|nr:hypothetical protein [Winogradskyella maritima]